MTPEQYEKVGDIFHAALELQPPERGEYLRQTCAGDDELRKEVESLLALDDSAKDFIEKPGCWLPDPFATDALDNSKSLNGKSDLLATDELYNPVEVVVKYCTHCQRQYSKSQRYCPDDNFPLSLRDPYHLIGKTLAGKYFIEALVGVGGMGAVYSAWHSSLNRRVAFKILQPNLAVDNDHILLFKREVKVARRLDHENITKIIDAGRADDGIVYMAVEWLEGVTLAEELATSGPMGLQRAIEIIRQVAAALEAAHSRRIIHRDLKPSNIMLIKEGQCPEKVKVLDFGIAKIITDTVGSRVSAALGTPHYASPEQLQVDSNIDRRSDIYSLGVLLYQMLTGELPFNASSVHALIRLHMEAEPPSILKARPELPAILDQLVSRMLAKDPDQRPQRAKGIIATLDQIVEYLPPQIWFCPRCGRENLPVLTHCPKCKTLPSGAPMSMLLHITREGNSLIQSAAILLVIAMQIAFLIIVYGGLLFGLMASPNNPSTPPTQTSKVDDPEIPPDVLHSHVIRGREVFEKLPPMPGIRANPVLLRQSSVSALSLMVTENSWKELSKDQQIDLTWYVQSLIPRARAVPKEYLVMMKYMEENRSLVRGLSVADEHYLCNDCWAIFIGEDFDENGVVRSVNGRVVVKGDFNWDRATPADKSVKGGEFRKQ